jgi:hypothetical protein
MPAMMTSAARVGPKVRSASPLLGRVRPSRWLVLIERPRLLKAPVLERGSDGDMDADTCQSGGPGLACTVIRPP